MPSRKGKWWLPWVAVTAALVLSGGVVLADAKPEIKVRLLENLRVPEDGRDTWVEMPDGKEVRPGDQIRYTVELTNAGNSEASLPRAFGPIPTGTAFVAGTASVAEGLQVEYSIDGGKNYSAQPTIVVKDEDGTQRTVPAPPERYTIVRWTWREPLSAGNQIQVSYQVRVK